ncbi:tetratricopeptide repeat protein [Erythrobacter arachoides]|uniref:Tetratricopeptide repeat protein n=1 Tax=Aurantiacibacter arachoides TaxID=1850444 RepID=A0A845A1X1_9SPHN|nr:tetratricopeptide repeat protein [Aurantiacibacter arachoides]MXO93136.1 tetratricopeptide repeat protein [Aurantiacibacter arachoides]GGD51768.1 hypothetical protein GCM10011411_09490 [Aurantiacibacter arachoides]
MANWSTISWKRTLSVAALALALAACGLSPEERMARAETAFAEHRFSEARLDLATVLQENERDPVALELLARTQLHLGDGEGAVATLERLAAAGRQPADFALLMGEAQLLRGRLDEALALVADSDTPEAARIAALAHIGAGDTDAARAAFAAGAQRRGDASRLLADYALFALRNGDPVRAAQLAASARDAAPDGLDPLVSSARVAQASGDLAKALEFYERAAAVWPESRVALLGQIGILGDLGRLAEARPLIADVARRTPGDPDVVYLQARLTAEDGDWTEVREMLQPLEGEDDPRLQLLYSRALVELDLPEQALPRLTSLMRRSPNHAATRRLLAQAQLDAGDAVAAYATIRPLASNAGGNAQDLAIFSAAARASGRSADIAQARASAPPAERVGTLLSQGDAALRGGNWRAAIDAYEELRRWTGDSNAMVLNNLAYARSRTGETEEALRLAESALQLAPRNPSVMDTAGWLLVQSGSDRSRGLRLLEQAAELAPDNTTIADHLRAARNT